MYIRIAGGVEDEALGVDEQETIKINGVKMYHL